MARLKIFCFGAFYATLDETPLVFDTDKARALLVYLAIEAPRPQRRQYLAGLFWSDMPEERALHNLRQTLSVLRKTLQDNTNPAPFLLIQRDSVQINPASDIWLDVSGFEQEINAALRYYRHCPENNEFNCRLNLRQLQRAIKLFRGWFLDQMYLSGSPVFDEWASLRREAFNQQAIEALAILAELFERRGEYAQARQFANQIATLAPWDENAQVQVMRLLAVESQWSAAQAQYRSLRHYLQEQIGVEPAAETLALFEAIRRSAAQNTALPALRQPIPHNLPPNTSPFVGRESELDTLAEALADPHCRLLTLHGPGGVGKTRLALQAANEQRGIFEDGVFFFPLVSVTDAALLPRVIAETLGFTFFGNEPPSEQLLRFVEDKHMVWVLDNLEQLLPFQADNLLSQVLQRALGIIIIATSRQRLNLREECIFPVEGLSYPHGVDVLDIEHQEAIQLFTGLAKRVHPDFNLNAEIDLQSVAGICQLLEGFPLGVELAAAALWAQTPVELFTNLSNSLRGLASSSVDVSGRHSSLWAACEISWVLLSQQEQEMLARLSVFRGGFETTMAQETVSATEVLLASFFDKSLLRRDSSGRYDFHEVLRQFAGEKLATNSEQASLAHTCHALNFVAFLNVRLNPLKSTGQLQALVEIDHEWENIRQAWGWLVAELHGAAIAECAEAIFHFCTIRSRYREGIDLFTQAAEKLEGFPQVLAKILTFQGALAFRLQANDLCEGALNRALNIFTTQNLPNDQALCLVYASGLAFRRKNPILARQRCEQSLTLFEQTGDAWGRSYALYQLGLLESRAGRILESQQAFLTSLQIARDIDDQRRQIGPLNLLGDLSCQLGNYAEAQSYFEESLTLSRMLDDRFNTGQALINLGTTFHSAENYDQAKRCYDESLVILQEIRDLGNQSLVMANLGELALAKHQFAESISYSKQGLALATQADDEWAVLICWINLSDAALGQKDQEMAQKYLAEALPLAAQSAEPALMLRTLLHLGRYYLLRGQSEKAIPLLGLVIHHEATYDEHRQVAREVLFSAGLPIPSESNTSLEAVILTELV